MAKVDRLNENNILEEELFIQIFSEEDEIARARLINELKVKAKELKVASMFNRLLTAYKKVYIGRSSGQRPTSTIENWTNFTGPYDNMLCKGWIASDRGIYINNPSTGYSDILACYHPILPIERLRNLESGEEQIKIAYRRNNKWEEIIVPKNMIASASKIVALSGRGIAVTSENAKYLVRYLADVENANEEHIKIQNSSSKLGWIKGVFLPYDKSIIFDGEAALKQMYESVRSNGESSAWYSLLRQVRAFADVPLRLLITAAFSSVLIKLTDGLPFFIDLWGKSGTGKTIALMLSASIWGNPNKGAYLKDYASTDVGLETVSSFLNNLPLILDDTSKKSEYTEKNFEKIVYNLCSGKGKTRATKDLGLTQERYWDNCILTTGERPLHSYLKQGGAINRVLEIEYNEVIFANPRDILEVIKNNYGFAGKDFIEVINSVGIETIRDIQKKYLKELSAHDDTQKQGLSLSIILTADELIEKHLFKDGINISVEDARRYIVSRDELSEGSRCYSYLMDKINMNPSRFENDSPVEQWGIVGKGEGGTTIAFLYPSALSLICEAGGYNRSVD